MTALSSSASAVDRWNGGVCPFEAGWRTVMMWWFVISDGLLFAGFLAAYGYARLLSPAWPDPGTVFNLPLLAAMTVVLLASGATVAMAAEAGRRHAWPEASRYLVLTIGIGLLFLGMQVYEWRHLIAEGARLQANPWGDRAFGAYFFVITGFHGLHVLTGALVLGVTAGRVGARRATAEGLDLAALYWHFVEMVWVFIFTLFYLL